MAPDRRRHRGAHPRDRELFAERHVAVLRQAVAEFSWLLSREYSPKAALKLVGDRYSLAARQRLAVLRCGCDDRAVDQAAVSAVEPDRCAGQALGIDGYNLLITLESGLSGGLVLIGRDGRYRDLAAVHGSYRTVRETGEALLLILWKIAGMQPSRVDCYLDQPVSNSGRLKTRIAELLEETAFATCPFNVELSPSPDRLLKRYDGVVATTDSVVLRHCRRALDLAGTVIRERVSGAWVLDLREAAHPDDGDGDRRW